MENKNEILLDIEKSKIIVEDMISKAKEQGAKNFDMLYIIDEGLSELLEILKNEKTINRSFYEKWSGMMGWVHRVFEDHPLLDLIYKINKWLNIEKQNS